MDPGNQSVTYLKWDIWNWKCASPLPPVTLKSFHAYTARTRKLKQLQNVGPMYRFEIHTDSTVLAILRGPWHINQFCKGKGEGTRWATLSKISDKAKGYSINTIHWFIHHVANGFHIYFGFWSDRIIPSQFCNNFKFPWLVQSLWQCKVVDRKWVYFS